MDAKFDVKSLKFNLYVSYDAHGFVAKATPAMKMQERSEWDLLSKAFDYSALRLCVGGEGKSRHIPGGHAGSNSSGRECGDEGRNMGTQELTLQLLLHLALTVA